MDLHVVRFGDDGIEKVRLLAAADRDEVKRAFADGAYSHLDLRGVYPYEEYRDRIEDIAQNAHGLVRFGELAFESLPTEYDVTDRGVNR